jgi:hypothetical protein
MATDITATPMLVNGDNLTRDEFIRRWEQMPGIKRAELIGGIVYMPSPLSTDHGETDFDVTGWLCFYKAMTPGCIGGSNVTSYILDDCPQPDVNLRIAPECGGRSYVEDKYLADSPEMLTEVCLSSESIDLNQKLELYEEAKVQEYLVVIVKKKEIVGTASKEVSMCSSIQMPKGFIAHESSLGYGSIARHSSTRTWFRCWPRCKKASRPTNISGSSKTWQAASANPSVNKKKPDVARRAFRTFRGTARLVLDSVEKRRRAASCGATCRCKPRLGCRG